MVLCPDADFGFNPILGQITTLICGVIIQTINPIIHFPIANSLRKNADKNILIFF